VEETVGENRERPVHGSCIRPVDHIPFNCVWMISVATITAAGTVFTFSMMSHDLGVPGFISELQQQNSARQG
jgi:hypothetical protein